MTAGPSLEDLGFRVVAAGPDVAIGDREGFNRHNYPDQEALRADLAAWRSRAWMTSRATLAGLRSIPQAPWSASILGSPSAPFLAKPVYLDQSVPTGYLRPVYIERTSEES